VLGLSWQPQIAEEVLTVEQVDAGFVRMQELLGVKIDVLYCPHGGGPPVCWCRKPLPGLGVVFIQKYRLDPSSCIYVGADPQDPGFADGSVFSTVTRPISSQVRGDPTR